MIADVDVDHGYDHRCASPPIMFRGQIYQCPICKTYYKAQGDGSCQQWAKIGWLGRWVRGLD